MASPWSHPGRTAGVAAPRPAPTCWRGPPPRIAGPASSPAVALPRQGDHVGAEGHYRLAALCGGSQAALPWFNLAVLLEDLGRRAEAVAHYQAARERALAAGDHALLDDATGNLVALLHAGADVWSQREAVRVLAESRKQRGRG
jgi:hypothetical protein